MCASAQGKLEECCRKIMNSAPIETGAMNKNTDMSVEDNMLLKAVFPITLQNRFGTGRTIVGKTPKIVVARHLEPVGKNVAFQTVDANTKWVTRHFEPTFVGTYCRRFVYQEVWDDERRCHHVTTKFIVGDTTSVLCVRVSSVCTKDQKRRSVFLIHLTH